MITGRINEKHEAKLSVQLRGAGSLEITIEFTLDTGFSEYLTLSLALILELAWQYVDSVSIRLADGSFRNVHVYDGRVFWNGSWRNVLVQASDGDPLLGMALLRGNYVCLEVVPDGEVTIEPVAKD
jgi:clan AA aspartic protease